MKYNIYIIKPIRTGNHIQNGTDWNSMFTLTVRAKNQYTAKDNYIRKMRKRGWYFQRHELEVKQEFSLAK